MSLLLKQLMLVAGGGAVGALTRTALQWGLANVFPRFPLGTFLANAIGCFLAGLMLPWLPRWSPLNAAFLLSGFLGAFTTFSSFAIELQQLANSQRLSTALAYLLATLGSTLLSCWLGWWFGQKYS